MPLSAGTVFPTKGVIVGHDESPDSSWATNVASAFDGVVAALLTHHSMTLRTHDVSQTEYRAHFGSTGTRYSERYLLVYIAQGTGQLWADNKKHELKPGSWVLVPPRVPYVLVAGPAQAPLFQFACIEAS